MDRSYLECEWKQQRLFIAPVYQPQQKSTRPCVCVCVCVCVRACVCVSVNTITKKGVNQFGTVT